MGKKNISTNASKANAPVTEATEAEIKAPKAPEAIRSIAVIDAEIDKAMVSRDAVKCQSLFNERAKAEKLEAKSKAEYRKANEAKFVEARGTFSEYMVETFELAMHEFTKANGEIAEYLGDKLNAVRITLAGSIDKAGAIQTNTSCALLTATAKKTASSGERTGNFHSGERGNLLNSGMSEAQIVEKFGSDEQKAEYAAQKGTEFRNQRYSLAKKLLKQNNII